MNETKKVVIITGVLGDIGLNVMIQFYLSGYNIIGIDIKDLDDKYCDFIYKYYKIDLSNGDLMDVFNKLVNDCYRIDTVVHLAAKQIEHKIHDNVIVMKEWDSIFNTNVKSIYQLLMCSFEHLKMVNGNVIIITSIHCFQSSTNVGLYAITKNTLGGLIRNFAIEWSKFGIRVNGIAAGAINTSMLINGITRRGDSKETALKKLIDKHPIGKIGEPNDIGEFVIFLADNNKSSYMTGQNYIIDGGVSIVLSSES